MENIRGYLSIIGATIFWGISATTAKFLFIRDINPLILVQTRMTFSCISLFLFFLWNDRTVFKVHLNDLSGFALLGIIGVAGSNITYYYIINATNVATGILLQYMAPLLVLGFAVIKRNEELSPVKFLAAIISLAGCFLAVRGERVSFLHLSAFGIIMGISTPVVWAFNNISLRHLLNRHRVWTVTMYAFIFATIFWMFFNPPWKLVTAGYSAKTWGVFFIFAMMSVLIPHSLYFIGMQYLTASRAIITASFEPVVAIGSAFIFLRESLTPVQIGGAALVIAAILLLQYKKESGAVLTDQNISMKIE
ncbi:MAG: DMT family transporter [Bacteroidota bacterium]